MKEKDNLVRAREIMGKIDPELLPSAIGELMIEADEAEKPDVEETKKALKKVYDSIPEGKDKASIMTKALNELEADIFGKEVKAVKERLSGFSRETLLEAAYPIIEKSQLDTMTKILQCEYYLGLRPGDWYERQKRLTAAIKVASFSPPPRIPDCPIGRLLI